MTTSVEETNAVDYEVCNLCIEERRLLGLEPRALVQLGVTTNRQIEVWVCPSCDAAGVDDGAL